MRNRPGMPLSDLAAPLRGNSSRMDSSSFRSPQNRLTVQGTKRWDGRASGKRPVVHPRRVKGKIAADLTFNGRWQTGEVQGDPNIVKPGNPGRSARQPNSLTPTQFVRQNGLRREHPGDGSIRKRHTSTSNEQRLHPKLRQAIDSPLANASCKEGW